MVRDVCFDFIRFMTQTPNITPRKITRRMSVKAMVNALCEAGVSPDDIIVHSSPDGSVEVYCRAAQETRKMSSVERFKAQHGPFT